MRTYDPAKTPNAREWLALDEQIRISLVAEFHQAHGGYGGSLEGHSGIHAAVETQLAMDVLTVREVLGRLRKSGVGRHEAVHSIGAALTEHMVEVAKGNLAPDEVESDYLARLQAL